MKSRNYFDDISKMIQVSKNVTKDVLIMRKPKLSIEQQIQHLKNKGVTFNACTEEEAKNHLRNNNNFFKLTSYRKNYDKNESGENKGQYIGLDFGALKDIAIIDMEFRYLLLQISLDVEHYIKMDILRLIEDTNEDGYSIVVDFMESLDDERKEKLENELSRNEGNEYNGELIEKYEKEYPVWVFLELLSFGRLVSFYRFAADRYNDKRMNNIYYMLLSCKTVRNAAAHNSCILNNLRPGSSKYDTCYDVTRSLCKIKTISKETRDKRMSNIRIQEVVTLLYTHKMVVTSDAVHKKVACELNELIKRMFNNQTYYATDSLIIRTFYFLKEIIDNWFAVK